MITLIVLVLMVGMIGVGLIAGVQPWVIALGMMVLPTLVGLSLVSIRLIPLHAIASQRGFGVSLPEMYGLVFRRVPVRRLIDAHARLQSRGTPVVGRRMIELHQAGGDVDRVLIALEIMHEAGVRLDWDEAASWSLAGADVVGAAHRVAESRRSGRTLSFEEACGLCLSDDEAAFAADADPS